MSVIERLGQAGRDVCSLPVGYLNRRQLVRVERQHSIVNDFTDCSTSVVGSEMTEADVDSRGCTKIDQPRATIMNQVINYTVTVPMTWVLMTLGAAVTLSGWELLAMIALNLLTLYFAGG